MQIVISVMIAMLAIGGVARAQNYVIDQGTSDAITKYLRMNELPMVTAQFSTSPGGSKQLILTGSWRRSSGAMMRNESRMRT